MSIARGPLMADLLAATTQLSKQLEDLAPQPVASRVPGAVSDVALIRNIVAARRAREGHVPADLLGEPAWDILLDLYIAEVEGRTSYSMSCCLAAAVPQTTGLRYVKRLVMAGLIAERQDYRDSRRTLVALTDKGREAIAGWLAQWRRSREFVG